MIPRIEGATAGPSPSGEGPARAVDQQGGGPVGSDRILSCSGISKTFGGVQALQDVSFDVGRGSITGLIGPNGAGKTTLFNCLTGFLHPDRGEVVFEGARISGLTPHHVARRGMVRTFQSVRMFQGLTVFESVLAGRYARHGVVDRVSHFWTLRSAERRTVLEILAALGLGQVADRRCTDLPLVAQRKVEIARALACDPRLLLLDEPTAGATPTEREELASVLRELRKARGLTIVLIEHSVPFVVDLSDYVYALDFGRMVAQGPPAEVINNPLVQEIYLGA